jgi:hypothetical protein
MNVAPTIIHAKLNSKPNDAEVLTIWSKFTQPISERDSFLFN